MRFSARSGFGITELRDGRVRADYSYSYSLSFARSSNNRDNANAVS